MKLRTLESSEESLMLELLRSEKASHDTDFYLDRGNSFWGVYNWYSKGQQYCHGVFEDKKLVGMVAVVKLPFNLKGSSSDTFLATDMLIHPEYRKSFAAARLFTGLHTELPSDNFINLWIENRAGFAQAIPKFSKRLKRSTETPRSTNLITVYPNQNLDVSENKLIFELSEDWSEINEHLELYQKANDSWVNWKSKIEIKDVFKRTILFKFTEGAYSVSGLIIDRGNLQTVRWNGQSRLLIEKYRRSLINKSINFDEDSELPFANICFVIGLNTNQNFSPNLTAQLCQWGFQNSYFGINFRDVNVSVPKNVDHALFPRRFFLSSVLTEATLHSVSEGLPKEGPTLESIYL